MSIAPVVIEFLAKGTPNVAASVRNVVTTLARAEQQATRDAEKGARDRQKAVDKSAAYMAKVRERSATMAGQYAAREAARATRVTEQAARAQVRAVEKAEQDKQRAVERSAANMARIRERSATMAGQYAVREADRQIREANRIAKARERDEKATGRDRGAFANAMYGAASQGVAAGTRRITSMASQTAGIAAQLGGGFSIADSVMTQSKLRGQAAALSASTQMAEAGKRRIGGEEIYSKAKAIGIQQNMDPGDVLKGFDEIKKLSGDLDQAMRVMPGVARLATATGGNVAEMSGLAANIIAANPSIKDDELEKQMRVFTKQGVVGGVEVADFAKYGSRLTAGASLFGGDSSKNMATMGAIAQISRQYGGASSPAEAALASQRFATDVASHAASLKSSGIDVSDHHGNLKGADAILMEMVQKTGGDVTKLKSMGLGDRGIKALTGVSAIYKNAGGGDAGMKAVQAEFGKYTTGVTEKEVSAAERTVLGAPDKQLFAAMEQLRTAVGEALLPEFLKLVPVIQESTPAFVALLKNGVPAFIELIKGVSDFVQANKGIIADISAHPIGAIMAYEVTKSIGSAGLGELVKRLITSSFSAGGGVPGAGVGAGAAGGGGALAGAGVMAGAAFMAYTAYDVYAGTRNAMAQGQEGGAAAGKALMSGSAADRAKAEEDIAAARGQSGALDTASAWLNRGQWGLSVLSGSPVSALGEYGANAVSGLIGGKSTSEHATETIKADAFVSAADDAAGAFGRAAAAADKFAASANASGPHGKGRESSILE